jgi:hypothetical protein
MVQSLALSGAGIFHSEVLIVAIGRNCSGFLGGLVCLTNVLLSSASFCVSGSKVTSLFVA